MLMLTCAELRSVTGGIFLVVFENYGKRNIVWGVGMAGSETSGMPLRARNRLAMQRRRLESSPLKYTCPICLTVILVAGLLSAGCCYHKSRSETQASTSAHSAQPLAGMQTLVGPTKLATAPVRAPIPAAQYSVVYVDPVSGQFGEPPPAFLSEILSSESAFTSSGEGLVVTLSPVPGGGKMIDLQGRFQNAMTAVAVPGAAPSTACLNAAFTPPPTNSSGAMKSQTKQ